jgi:hypothetical protein
VLALNIFSFQHVPLLAQAPDTALVFEGRERVNPTHLAWNFFLLKLVTLVVIRISLDTDLDIFNIRILLKTENIVTEGKKYRHNIQFKKYYYFQ